MLQTEETTKKNKKYEHKINREYEWKCIIHVSFSWDNFLCVVLLKIVYKNFWMFQQNIEENVKATNLCNKQHKKNRDGFA